jgi:hypothetical protein
MVLEPLLAGIKTNREEMTAGQEHLKEKTLATIPQHCTVTIYPPSDDTARATKKYYITARCLQSLVPECFRYLQCDVSFLVPISSVQ